MRHNSRANGIAIHMDNNNEGVMYLQPMILPKRFDIFPPDWGCSEGLSAFSFFKNSCTHDNLHRRETFALACDGATKKSEQKTVLYSIEF